ncbi:MAG: hypothetical protein A2Z88_06205 [Omnitrophica WOR_2 bacterium GWA2_47_8]|nr:MAG: hypothetical protein A2Z88_06205 [Omnitrophica WOR_2 bacterium GWA2_47_8]
MPKQFYKLEQEEKELSTREGLLRFALKRSRNRRTMSICIDEKGSISVYAPGALKEQVIQDFIHKKAGWITRKSAELKKRHDEAIQQNSSGEKYYLFQGEKYPLDIPREELIKWYRKQALEIIGVRVFQLARTLGLVPEKVNIRTQKRIWGSCYHRTKTINLNWQLVMAPLEVMDYVIVHELCHLAHPDHSKRFWNKVKQYAPDYKLREKWLKEHHLALKVF